MPHNKALKLTAARRERVVDLALFHESFMSRAGGNGGSLALRSVAVAVPSGLANFPKIEYSSCM